MSIKSGKNGIRKDFPFKIGDKIRHPAAQVGHITNLAYNKEKKDVEITISFFNDTFVQTFLYEKSKPILEKVK